MKKRILALSLAAAMVVGALASCNGTETPVTSSQQTVEARDVALVLWGSEADQDFLKAVSTDFATAYAADHEDVKSITVDVKIVGEDQSAGEALKDINAAADVFGVPGDQTSALAEAKAIYAMPDAVVSQIKELVGENTAAKTFYNGSYYGFPYSPNTAQALYYNKSIYTEDDVKSLNTMLEKCPEGVKAFGMDENAFFSSTWYFTAGGELFTNSDKNVCTFDSDACVEMLTWVQENAAKMYKGGTGDAAALLQDGSLAAYADGSWNAGTLTPALGDNFAIAKLPEVTVGDKTMQMTCFGGVKYYAVNAASKEPEVAVALAQYLASPEVQLKKYEEKQAKNELAVPTALSLLDNATIKANPVVGAYMQQGEYIVVQEPVIPGDWWNDAAALYKGIFDGEYTGDQIKEEIAKHVASWKAM